MADSSSSNIDDRFTERARQVLRTAQEEAKRLDDRYIGTEHLLVGLVHEDRGLASRVLRDMGVSFVQVRRVVEEASRRAGDVQRKGSMEGLSPRTKRVIESAVDEARKMNHQYIGTEHLLLGLIREGSGPAIDVLKEMGIDPDLLRTQTTRAIMQAPVRPRAERKKAGQTPLMDQLGVDCLLYTSRCV